MPDDLAPDTHGRGTYPSRVLALPAFDLVGFTQIVHSGGALYDAVRGDGRWELLRRVAGNDGAIWGVASLDRECPKGLYRYTMAVEAAAYEAWGREGIDAPHAMHIAASEWVAFAIEDFGAQYGSFWQADPYSLILGLGWEFNSALGLHLDVWGPRFGSDHDGMEFLMPVRRPAR